MRAKDIAELMGVSTSTVSLVMNNKPGVSEQKRREILDKIQELNCGYLLKEAKTERKNIGFVVYKRKGNIVDESPFFSYFMEGISERLQRMSYNLIVLYMSSNMDLAEQKRIIKEAGCEGFIVFAVEMLYKDMQVFKDSEYPFVMLDNSFKVNDVDTVAINNTSGTRSAMNYLRQQGHKKIGYIRSKIRINSFEDRFIAYKNALSELNLSFDEAFVAEVGYSDSEARADMLEYIRNAQALPTAFVADNDLIACGALKGIQDAGLCVPDDISLVGFDDRPIAQMATPPISTMSVAKDAFGNKCVDLLMDKINNHRMYAMKIEIGTVLIRRESVKQLS